MGAPDEGGHRREYALRDRSRSDLAPVVARCASRTCVVSISRAHLTDERLDRIAAAKQKAAAKKGSAACVLL